MTSSEKAPSHSQPEELMPPRCQYTFFRGSSNPQEAFTIEVQFSEQEMESLARCHEIIRGEDSLIRKRAAQSSGFERILSVSTPLPWGYRLQDRGRALEAITATAGTATQALDHLSQVIDTRFCAEDVLPVLQEEKVAVEELVGLLQPFIPQAPPES